MNLKKEKILATVIIFILCFPFHFLYDWLPNNFTSIFFPVNESIWEHMKLIFIPYLLYGLIEYFILKNNKIKANNFLIQLVIVPVLGITLYLLMFIPIYLWIGENMIISIGLLFIIVIIEQIMSYYLLKYREIKYQAYLGIIGIILLLIGFGYFTYKPLENFVFFDPQNKKYGITIYQK